MNPPVEVLGASDTAGFGCSSVVSNWAKSPPDPAEDEAVEDFASLVVVGVLPGVVEKENKAGLAVPDVAPPKVVAGGLNENPLAVAVVVVAAFVVAAADVWGLNIKGPALAVLCGAPNLKPVVVEAAVCVAGVVVVVAVVPCGAPNLNPVAAAGVGAAVV